MDQEIWEEVNDCIQMEEIFRADSLRSLINKDNIIECVKFYRGELNDTQKMIVINVFCADKITDATVATSKEYLSSAPDTSIKSMDMVNYVRSLAVCQLEGSFKNSDKYMSDLEARRSAEQQVLNN